MNKPKTYHPCFINFENKWLTPFTYTYTNLYAQTYTRKNKEGLYGVRQHISLRLY
jgi:hypothetical protein